MPLKGSNVKNVKSIVAVIAVALMGGTSSADICDVNVPTNRIVVGVELGSVVSNVCWRPVRYKDAFAGVFRTFIYDVTPVTKRICGVRFFGYEREGFGAKAELERDLLRAVAVLKDSYGLTLKKKSDCSFRGRLMFDENRENAYASVRLDVARSTAICLDISDCELMELCRKEQEAKFEAHKVDVGTVRLCSLMGFSFSATNSEQKTSLLNCKPFCRVDLFYPNRSLAGVAFVRSFSAETTFDEVKDVAEKCKDRIENDLGVRFVESNSRGGPYSNRECECSYRSLTMVGRFILTMAVRKPSLDGNTPREMTIHVEDRLSAYEQRKEHVANPSLKRMRVGSFLVGERYEGSLADLLPNGMDNAFSVTNVPAFMGLRNCVAYVDKVTTNVIEVEFWDASCAYVDELRLRHDFDDLCECLEEQYGIVLPAPDSDEREKGLCLHCLDYGDFNIWVEAGLRWLPSQKQRVPTLSFRVRHCDAYDKWYESRFLARESEWKSSSRQSKKWQRRKLRGNWEN